MNTSLERVIAAIVSHVVNGGSYITKTKLLKLLYLFDIEYYRSHRETFTGFNWKYFHLGPWTAEFDPLLEGMVAQGVLSSAPSKSQDYDTVFYRCSNPVDVFKLFPEYKDERALRLVLNAWGASSTAEILDHVYFRTEPMKQGERERPLDFSVVPESEPVLYKRSSSGRTERELMELRSRFEKAQATKASGTGTGLTTPPRYDSEFSEAMSKLESMD